MVLNGFFKKSDRRNKHKFEIQIHYKPLVLVRENLGGHFIYARQRALTEAVEVTFGATSHQKTETEKKSSTTTTRTAVAQQEKALDRCTCGRICCVQFLLRLSIVSVFQCLHGQKELSTAVCVNWRSETSS